MKTQNKVGYERRKGKDRKGREEKKEDEHEDHPTSTPPASSSTPTTTHARTEKKKDEDAKHGLWSKKILKSKIRGWNTFIATRPCPFAIPCVPPFESAFSLLLGTTNDLVSVVADAKTKYPCLPVFPFIRRYIQHKDRSSLLSESKSGLMTPLNHVSL